MDEKGKQFCLEILKRGLVPSHDPAYYIGPAENFQKFDDPNFKEFAAKNDITPQTRIKVWKRGTDSFNVIKI